MLVATIRDAIRRKERNAMVLRRHIAQPSAVTRYMQPVRRRGQAGSAGMCASQISEGASLAHVDHAIQLDVLDPCVRQFSNPGRRFPRPSSIMRSTISAGNRHVSWDTFQLRIWYAARDPYHCAFRRIRLLTWKGDGLPVDQCAARHAPDVSSLSLRMKMPSTVATTCARCACRRSRSCSSACQVSVDLAGSAAVSVDGAQAVGRPQPAQARCAA